MITVLLLALSMQSPAVDRNSTGQAIMEACEASATGLRSQWTMKQWAGFMECKGYAMGVMDSLILTKEVCVSRFFDGSDRDSDDVVTEVRRYLRHMSFKQRDEPRYFAMKDALMAAYPCR